MYEGKWIKNGLKYDEGWTKTRLKYDDKWTKMLDPFRVYEDDRTENIEAKTKYNYNYLPDAQPHHPNNDLATWMHYHLISDGGTIRIEGLSPKLRIDHFREQVCWDRACDVSREVWSYLCLWQIGNANGGTFRRDL